jgi:hypothetical protein
MFFFRSCSVRMLFCSGIAFLAAVFIVSGCGSSSGNAGRSTSGSAPVIATQPVNQSVPMGVGANFSVSVDGTPPFSYQWSKNGVPQGTSNTYTTPATAFGDSGATFTVTISNALGSVTSNPATLTVTARAPKAGDLRFEQVDAATTVNGYTADPPELSTLSPAPPGGTGLAVIVSGDTGTPLWYGGPLWQFYTWRPPSGIPGPNMTYFNDYLGNLSSDLLGQGAFVGTACSGASNSVVTSVNLSPGTAQLAMSCVQSDQSNGFDIAQHTVSPTDFQSAASQDGEQGRVITAVSYDANNQIFYLSYGWQTDTTTVYETQVATATIETAGSVATSLANAGYIITAIGGGDAMSSAPSSNADSVIMVGTRVKGDTMPRPILTVTEPPSPPSLTQIEQGYAVVGVVWKLDSTGNLLTRTWIGER